MNGAFKTLCFIVLLMISIQLFSIYSSDFVIGCYSYLRSQDPHSANNTIADYMRQAHFNSTICEVFDSDDVKLQAMLSLLSNNSNNGIDAFLTDYAWDNMASYDLYSTRDLVLSNYQKFEAELSSLANVYQNGLDSNDENYYYCSPDVSTSSRVGGVGAIDPYASNELSWICDSNNNASGFAYNELYYRWNNVHGGSTRIGNEFQFVKNMALSQGQFLDSQYLDENYLYFKYVFKSENRPSNPADILLESV